MCDSMPILEDFNFNDINLDFLESSPRQKLSTTVPQEKHSTEPLQSTQLQISKTKYSVQELSKRIAEVDSLVAHIRKVERERNDLRNQLEELHRSTKEVRTLYANEKRRRIEEESKTQELLRQNQSLDTDLTAKTLEVDQLQAQLDDLKVPIEYGELAVRYLKLVQKFDEDHALHWQEQAVVRDLQKYCKEKGLKVPAITQRSPRKRKTSAAKVDSETQCNIGAMETLNTERKELRDQSTQHTKVTMRDQGCQHIGTTTTRSTTTSCFIKYHDVGVNCNLLDFKDVLNDMLDDMRSWSTHASPLSPIADLDKSSDELLPVVVPLKQLSPPNPKLSSPPLPIELKTVGTCTFICNVQRNIDYTVQLPTIKRSNSRPPSSLFFDTVKNENIARSTTTTPLPSTSLNNPLPTIPNLFPNAFDELWQIFGHMLYGLLNRRVGNGVPFSNEMIAPTNITNQQEFYSWLQTFYLDIHKDERIQIQQPDTQRTINERNSNREGTTPGSILEQQTQRCNVASPLNFSNAAPIKCTTSGQYLFKPKAQRSGNHATNEESSSRCTERNSVGTSPIRCIISSPSFSRTNDVEENETDHTNDQIISDSFEDMIENRTPSAFTSPKSNKDQSESENSIKPSETAKKILKLFPSVKNHNKTLQSIEKLLHRNLKKSRKRIIEKRKRKRVATTWLNIGNETAVDFLANLNFFNDKSNDAINNTGNLPKSLQAKEYVNQQTNTSNISKENEASKLSLECRKKGNQLRELNRSLFGSDTDNDGSDDEEIKSNISMTLDNINKAKEKRESMEDFQILLSPTKTNNTDEATAYHSNSTISSDDNDDIDLRGSSSESSMKNKWDDTFSLNKSRKRLCSRRKNSEKQLRNSSNVSVHSKNKFCSRQTHFESSTDSTDKDEELFKQTDYKTRKTVNSFHPISIKSVTSTSSEESSGDFGDSHVINNFEKEVNIADCKPSILSHSKNLLSENTCVQGNKDGNVQEYKINNLANVNLELEKEEAFIPSNSNVKNVKLEEMLKERSKNYLTEVCKPLNKSITFCSKIANEDQLSKLPNDICKSPKHNSTEELEDMDVLNECSKSNKTEPISKHVANLSPLSNISSSPSSESRLVIVSDVDETYDSESIPIISKKRGRKRKSVSLTPLDSTINIENTPCKRSARLLAKQKLNKEQQSQRKDLPLLTLEKYTRCINKEAVEYKKGMNDIAEEQTSKITWTGVKESCNIDIPVLGSLLENNETMPAVKGIALKDKILDGKKEDFLSEQNKEIEDKYVTELMATLPQASSSKHYDDNPSFISSPASPTPPNKMSSDNHLIKEIPLEPRFRNLSKCNKTLLYNLTNSYEAHHYHSFNSPQLKDVEKVKVGQIEVLFKEYLTLQTQSEDTALHLVEQVLSASQDSKIIAHALCTCLHELPRSAPTPYDTAKNTAAPILNRPISSIIQQTMTHVMSQLIPRLSELTQTLLTVIESILFNVQNASTVLIDSALNLTELYTLTLKLQVAPMNENPARLFIAKCLYYHKVKAIPMIYIVLCEFPTTLPHREERNYDRSDALITVIQHVLMCTTYNMDSYHLFHREMLSKLRYVYHFEIFKPDFQDVLQNLTEKLRAGKLNNLKYAFAVFCKRIHPERVIRDVIQKHLIPLSNEYYSLLQQTTEYDERTAALLDCYSSVIKPFPRGGTGVIVDEINNSLNIFKRFLSVVERPIIQEAAVHAIIRLQRFCNIDCYNALDSFQPEYELQPLTRAALRTFIYRKPHSFWKTLLTQSG